MDLSLFGQDDDIEKSLLKLQMAKSAAKQDMGITPGVPDAMDKDGGGLFGKNLGTTLGNVGKGASILGDLAGIYFGMQQLGLARDSMKMQKRAYNNNLLNSTQSYNTSLEDRIRARHHTEGRDAGATDAYLNQHRLKARTI